jgi:GTP cyclohydrolase I
MNNNKLYITWPMVFEQLEMIDHPEESVYGIPKGGMIAAGFLTQATNATRPEHATIILDDILDSGETIKKYMGEYPKKKFHVLFNKRLNLENKWVVFPWEAQHPQGEETIQQNITRQLQYLGEDVEREGLRETPNRIVKSWDEIYSGYTKDPKEILTVFDADGYDEIVLLKDVEIFSMCEHHMLPFFGKAHVAYIPDKKIVGISKLARLVDIFARRLQIQERIGDQVTKTIMELLQPKGAACILECKHLCMMSRGVGKQNSTMTTSSMKGVFLSNPGARQELMQLIKG